MRPPTFTPLQPLPPLVALCTFPVVVISVPGPVLPARLATTRFELVARLEFFLRGRTLGGMLMVFPVPSMDLSKLARKPRSSSPPLQWCLRVLFLAPAILSSLTALHPLARLLPPDGDFIFLIRLNASLMKTGDPSVLTLPLLSLLALLVTPITLASSRP